MATVVKASEFIPTSASLAMIEYALQTMLLGIMLTGLEATKSHNIYDHGYHGASGWHASNIMVNY